MEVFACGQVSDIINHRLKISEDTTAHKALSIMNQKKITSLIVSSRSGKVKGICHIHNLLSHGIK